MSTTPTQENKKLSADDIDLEIDKVISEYKEVASIRVQKYNPNKQAGLNRQEVIDRMMQYDLLLKIPQFTDADAYRLSKFGHEVYRAGGWIQYHNNRIEHDRLIREQIQSTINTNVAQQRTNKTQRNILFATFGVTAVSVIIGGGAWYSNERLLDIERQRLEREQTQIIAPVVHPNVNVTLQRDTIVLIQPLKKK